MKIIIVRDYEELSRLAAEKVCEFIEHKPDAVLGLPTGSTPLGMYKELIDMYKRGFLSFKNITTFNLDEYEGLDKDDPNSYHKYMVENFFRHVDIDKDKINIPSGVADDGQKECLDYEEKIKKAGGIDLMILGIGNSGHIGFNEPAENFSGYSHITKLHDATIKANSRFFDSIEKVPNYALTMGIKSIMHCKNIMLLASGEAKAKVLKAALEGPIAPLVPSSALQLHRDLTVIADGEAGSLLSKR